MEIYSGGIRFIVHYDDASAEEANAICEKSQDWATSPRGIAQMLKERLYTDPGMDDRYRLRMERSELERELSEVRI